MNILCLFVAAIMLLTGPIQAEEVSTLPKSIESVNGSVEVSGQWVVTSRLNSTAPLLAQLNAVKIVCHQAQGICHEAVAALYTKEDAPQLRRQFLNALFSEYKITRWDSSGITAISAKPVADVEIQIDLKAGTARRRHQETKSRGNQTANPGLIVVWELK